MFHEQIPPWLQREMVQCTETEAEPTDSNDADRGSEVLDNDERRRREVLQNVANKTAQSPGIHYFVITF